MTSDDYIKWPNNPHDALRKLKAGFSTGEDLVWRAECLAELEAKGLNMRGMLAHISNVDISSAMVVVGSSQDDAVAE